jgi:enamine deaminase RidA (YjgF/YER057c/UK114 family)
MGELENKLHAMGHQVPALGGKGGNYVFHHLVGNVLYLSGNTGRIDGKLRYTGLLGKDVTVEQGYEMARCCALNHLAMIRAAVGDLDRIEQLIRMTGWVASAPGFVDQPKVVNGASDLFVELLGVRGEHCRSALGVSGLAGNAPVETELTLLVQV